MPDVPAELAPEVPLVPVDPPLLPPLEPLEALEALLRPDPPLVPAMAPPELTLAPPPQAASTIDAIAPQSARDRGAPRPPSRLEPELVTWTSACIGSSRVMSFRSAMALSAGTSRGRATSG